MDPGALATQSIRQPRVNLEEFTKNVKSTLNTLSLILIYLGISLPSYVTAAVHMNCFEDGDCLNLHYYIFIFTSVTFIGHLLFPISWFAQDRMYIDKLTKTYRLMLGSQ